MAIKISCENCQGDLTAPEAARGGKCVCEHCSHTQLIPREQLPGLLESNAFEFDLGQEDLPTTSGQPSTSEETKDLDPSTQVPGPRSHVHAASLIEIRVADARLDNCPHFDDLQKANRLVWDFPDMGLAKCRVILEAVMNELYREAIGAPGTRRLEQLIGDLGRQGSLPRKILALCEVVRELGNVGSHPILDEERLTHREAQLAFLALVIVLEGRQRKTKPPELELTIGE